jgi:hypothetical protein
MCSYCVMFDIQLVGCVYIREVPCFMSQLFGITCLQMSNYWKLEEVGKGRIFVSIVLVHINPAEVNVFQVESL